MFYNQNRIKLEMIKKFGKFKKIWKLKNTLVINWSKKKIKRELKNSLNENKDKTQTSSDKAEGLLGKNYSYKCLYFKKMKK